MAINLTPVDRAKYAAARRAVDLVEDGMKLGLGTGSTAAWMVRALAQKVRDEGLRLTCVPTSARTADLARELGLRVVPFEDAGWLDMTIDGTDEFDGNLALIKGGGGAHLMEKIVATASDRMVVITDASKEVKALGAFPLPVEVVPFGWQASRMLIEELLAAMDVMGTQASLRMNGSRPYITDEGNHILDLSLGRIGNPRQLSLALNQVPGVVENGLFIDICDAVVIGFPDGMVELRDITSGTVEHERILFEDTENIFSDV
ncbi:ribose-5-phosphate isomerase RpiA [Pararhodobacter oceanensis]|uniref:Ribose-5-phosphate isomerase A n=1 Tax=Pararhodobacter oceanensis TaxID=2172121 RepID=A0A2T8HYL5_9RHOB|nr:ribose-5-phosphate isomerase RpiA [Pararhodobacter oceanensis]PVH30501.1 ribose 5-phosphate isomerase A [Pararhodobacter oceanensis]